MRTDRENSPDSRRSSIDLLRIASALGIVWFHCGAPGAVFGYGGLPALLALSVGLTTAPGASTSLIDLAVKRAKRLLVPWLFWCGVYGVKQLAEAVIKGKSLGEVFEWWMLFTGPEIHLWYLPYAFVATTAAAWWRNSMTPAAVLWAGVVPSLAACSFLASTFPLSIPFVQWTFGFPAIWIGLALPKLSPQARQFGRVWLVMGVVAVICFICWQLGWRELSIPYAVGATALGLAWIVPIRMGEFTAWLGNLSYGLYLMHPLVRSIIQRPLRLTEGTLLAVVVALVTLCLVAVLRRGKLRDVM